MNKVGIIGEKVGMSSFYDESGICIPCSVVWSDGCRISQIKDIETDGYNSIQLSYGSKKIKNISKSVLGHLSKANIESSLILKEFRCFDISKISGLKRENENKNDVGESNQDNISDKNLDKNGSEENKNSKNNGLLGVKIKISDIFCEGDIVDVIGESKGKGFQGVVKRHGFSGVGGQTHGQHNRLRAPGSVGASSFPSRVFKGTRMAGKTGNKRVKVRNLKILKVLENENLIIIRGSIPGDTGNLILLERVF